jgi:hypothetical protein
VIHAPFSLETPLPQQSEERCATPGTANPLYIHKYFVVVILRKRSENSCFPTFQNTEENNNFAIIKDQ